MFQNDKLTLICHLEKLDPQEFFEGAIESPIRDGAVNWRPVDINQFYAVEVDFAEDLERANLQL